MSLHDQIAWSLAYFSALHKNGESHRAFCRLAEQQAALRRFGELLYPMDDPYARKLAAASLGHLTEVSDADFERVFAAELARVATGDFMEELNAQSTVEDLVFSAVRLVRRGANREVGLNFLTRIVEEIAEDRRYWNTSNYAMASLLQTDHTRFGLLFQAWSKRIDGPPMEHISAPSFESEREWRAAMAEGTCNQIFSLQENEEAAAKQNPLGPEDAARLDALAKALSLAT